MRRIMIIGGSGSGKSTLARQLGAITGLPVVHIDPMYWAPGWVQRPDQETAAMIAEAAARPEWIFEGNHSRSMTQRAARADLIIFLDMPRLMRVRRVIWRSLRHWGRSRPDMGAGCPERIDLDFVFGWVWTFDRTHRPHYLARLEDWRWQGRRVLHLRGRRAVRRFLADQRAGRYEAAHDRHD